MNKDVIYIEPEDDITDILANIKSAKNKIVALVPPKKVGVLRSAVNFKLIAKAARQSGKIVVLITTDESLLKLAENVKMPTARSLQSKPKLPADLDASEFGIDGEDDDEEEDENLEDEEGNSEDDDVIEEEPKKGDAKKEEGGAKSDVKKAAASRREPDMELNDDDLDDEENKKPAKKKKSTKSIPDFKKVRLPIILAVVAFILIVGFIFWALNIAPAAKISVKVSTSSQNFSENVSFVTDEKKAKPEEGIFYLEQKSITKTAEAEFSATGEVDKGTKATGSIQVIRPKGDNVDCNDATSTFSIPQGTVVSISGKEFITTSGGSANASDAQIGYTGRGDAQVCFLNAEINSGSIGVVAKENGEGYNIPTSSEGKLSLTTNKKYTVSSTAMTGGTSKKIKVVSQKDVETAEASLEGEGEEPNARKKLTSEFGDTYLLIENSFSASSGKISSSPAINEEVKDGVKPKVVKEIKYSFFAVEREAINKFIKAKTNVGDDTQTIYSTGIADKVSDDDKGRIESFKKENDQYTGKLKTVVKTGPEVTETMISEKSLGKKIGEVQSQLKSIKGVSDVKVDTSFFWVTSVPSDPNKVSFEITVE